MAGHARGRRLGLGDILLCLVVGKAELLDDGCGPVDDAALDIARTEFGQHLLLQDHTGEGVGQHWLQAIADLDAHLVFGGRQDEQGAVVLALLADAPGAAELIAVVRDVIALQRGQGDHHHLAAGLGLQPGELGGQLLLGIGRQHMSVVDDPAGQGRKGRRRVGRHGQEQEGQEGQERLPPPGGRGQSQRPAHFAAGAEEV